LGKARPIRGTWFAEEKAFLLPLPRNSYEMSLWKTATVSFNYHIAVDEQYYSTLVCHVYNRLKGRKRYGTISADEWNRQVALAQALAEKASKGEISEAELKRRFDAF